jgi:site-specific recombinase
VVPPRQPPSLEERVTSLEDAYIRVDSQLTLIVSLLRSGAASVGKPVSIGVAVATIVQWAMHTATQPGGFGAAFGELLKSLQ